MEVHKSKQVTCLEEARAQAIPVHTASSGVPERYRIPVSRASLCTLPLAVSLQGTTSQSLEHPCTHCLQQCPCEVLHPSPTLPCWAPREQWSLQAVSTCRAEKAVGKC